MAAQKIQFPSRSGNQERKLKVSAAAETQTFIIVLFVFGHCSVLLDMKNIVKFEILS